MIPPLSDQLARARSGREFLDVLQFLKQRSGRSAAHIATIAKIPRSTAYNFVSNGNTALPINRDHVERFVRACKVPKKDVEEVMRTWERLTTEDRPVPGPSPHSLPSAVFAPPAAPGPLSRSRTDRPPRVVNPSMIEFEPESPSDVGAAVRQQLRQILVSAGLSDHDLLEPLVAELRQRGCRPRKAWRLANELTQEKVAAAYNWLSGKPTAPMRSSRISEYESWPGPRGRGRGQPRPTLEVLKNLAVIYSTRWDNLVDAADLLAMPPADLDAYRDARAGTTTRPSGRGIARVSSSFVGRYEQQQWLRDRIEAHLDHGGPAVHVVNGLPGVGKTMLARWLVDTFAERYPDGVLWKKLHGHTDGQPPLAPAIALEQMLIEMGRAPELISRGDCAQQWRCVMRDRRMLIVLDDVLDSQQVLELLPHAPGCFVLITSRHDLTGLTGVTPLPLDSMPMAEAEELLVTLGQLPPDYDRDAAQKVLRASGGLPLAIRLMAGQLAYRGPDMLRSAAAEFTSLTERMQQGRAGEINDRSAERTLDAFAAEKDSVRAAFDMSYQRLSDPMLQRTMRLLGWFPGTEITPQILAAVADVPVEMAHAQARHLHEAGLLDFMSEQGPRYRIHDLVRMFARAQAAGEDPPSVRSAVLHRLVGHSLQIAELLIPPERFVMAGILTRPRRPFAPGAVAAAQTWLTREQAMLVELVREAASEQRTGELARLLAAALSGLRQWDDARGLFIRALEIARFDGDRDAERDALFGLATNYHLAFAYEPAANCYAQAYEIAQDLGSSRRAMVARWGFAEASRHIGEYRAAYKAYCDVHESARTLSDLRLVEESLRGMGSVNLLEGREPQARSCFCKALDSAEKSDDPHGRGWSLLYIAACDRELGMLDTALSRMEQAVRLAEQVGDRRLHVGALRQFGQIFHQREDPVLARRYYSESLAMARRNGDVHGEADALHMMGILEANRGARKYARELLGESLTRYQAMGAKPAAGQVIERLGVLGPDEVAADTPVH
ncbi:tetratricopeptide repeat protein [Nocardia sp. NPDC059240]|uniref:tetratricopeptide repeat protein n=1 Tax=Nocardia sp. NPDC059240 TaxID=3346786 RepID=UPI0036C5F6CB